MLRTLVAVSILALTAAAQTTWYVQGNGTPGGSGTQADPFGSIQQAVDAAANWDTVLVLPGAYLETVTASRVYITSEQGPEVTIIDGNGDGPVVWIDGELRGFTVRNGQTDWYWGDPTRPGGVDIQDHADVIDCVIENNTSNGGAGGVRMRDHALLLGCTVVNNQGSPGGVRVDGSSGAGDESKIRSCMIAFNAGGSSDAGGIFANEVHIYGSTIAYNTGGYGIRLDGSEEWTAFASSSILWGNELGQIIGYVPGWWTVVSSDVQVPDPSIFGGGNINADPLFVSVAGGDLHLTAASPCIDKGSTSVDIASTVPATLTDVDGEPRYLGSKPDMGADEYVIPPVQVSFAVQPTSTTVGANIAPPVEVLLLDGTSSTIKGKVQMALGNNPGDGDLSPSYSQKVAGSDGLAVFSNLTIDAPGLGYTLKALIGWIEVESDPFDVLSPIPFITSLDPESKPVGSDAFTLWVYGTGFAEGLGSSIVRWNGADLPTWGSLTSLSATVDASLLMSAADIAITVFNPAPGGGLSNAVTFSIENPAPTLGSITPDTALVGSSGLQLTAQGSDFVPDSVVLWEGAPLPTSYLASDTLAATVDASLLAAAGTASVLVQSPVPGGGDTSAVQFTIENPSPVISSVDPSPVSVGDAFMLTVHGTGFVPTSEVAWNGVFLPTVYLSGAQLTASVECDLLEAGTTAVTVVNPSPGGGTSSPASVTVNGVVPGIAALAPSSAFAGSGSFALRVEGTGFTQASTVEWNGADLPAPMLDDCGVLSTVVDFSLIASAGSAGVTVTTPGAGGGTSAPFVFSILDVPGDLSLFGPGTTITSGPLQPRSLTTGDLDQDGDRDVAVGLVGKVLWSENVQGDGSVWTSRDVSPAAHYVESVRMADIDGDGDPDLVSMNRLSIAVVQWHENLLGDGSSWSNHTVGYPLTQGFYAVPADVDGDGDLDVYSASKPGVHWYENTQGDGSSFSMNTVAAGGLYPAEIRAADMDRDGDSDVAAAIMGMGVRWYENELGDGSAWLQRDVSAETQEFRSLELMDQDSDGDVDIATASDAAGGLAWHENLAGGGLAWSEHAVAGAPGGARSVFAADLDGDGDSDLLSGSLEGDRVAWHQNVAREGSLWADQTVSTASAGPEVVIAADVDGDGDPDTLVASTGDGRVVWYENTRPAAQPGPFQAVGAITHTAMGARTVVAVDVDRDGALDALSASMLDGTVAWYRNALGGGTTWVESVITSAAPGARSAVAVDMDRDGDTDVLTASADDATVAWHQNTAGDGSAWTRYVITSSAGGARSACAADVDGDGDPDVLAGSYTDDTVAWHENAAGDGYVWTGHVITNLADGTRGVFAADLDRDGDVDALSASSLDDTVAWHENTAGDGSAWAKHVVTGQADGARSVTAADVDVDGDPDVLSASTDDTTVAWHENLAGDGSTWSSHVISSSVLGASSVQAADVDADGDPDAVATGGLDHLVRWFENAAGDGSTWVEHVVSTASIASSATAADVDGDGMMDILSASFGSNRVAWYPSRTLRCRESGISLSQGGTQSLALNAGYPLAGFTYFVLGSGSGTSPGLPVDGVVLPLNIPDTYFDFTVHNRNSPPYTDTLGILNGDGVALASITVPPGSNPGMAGLELHHAYLVFDPFITAVLASNPEPLTLLP